MAAAPPVDKKLRRVFELELERGCDNRTVIGGLDRLLVQLIEDGTGGPLRSHITSMTGAGYKTMDRDARKAWVEATLALLDGKLPDRTPAGRKSSRASTTKKSPRAIKPDDPVTVLPGAGKAAIPRYEKLGVSTVAEAATLFPRRFNDFTDVRAIGDLEPGQHGQTVRATVLTVAQTGWGRRRSTEAKVQDATGTLRVIWWNMAYVSKALNEGDEVVLSGRARVYKGRLQFENPEFEVFDGDAMKPGRLIPIYPATQGLAQKAIRRAVTAAVEAVAEKLTDPVPASLAQRDHLGTYADAVRSMHQPETHEEAEEARRRLALGEFLGIQAAVLHRRREWQQETTAPQLKLGPALKGVLESLPFELTGSQRDSLDDILLDIAKPVPMLRLLQGDVGSGKTVVAFTAMLAAVATGHQAAIMAPTEILAEQHHRSFQKLLGGTDEHSALQGLFTPEWLGRPVRVLFLTGSHTATEKARIRNDLEHGGADIIIGTHALLEDEVRIPRLGLAVVDEQHRFGVEQRATLRKKGTNPHLLVMTATPIPRTLALTVYGDLEVSTIDELPPGRKPVTTTWVHPSERAEAYTFLGERLDAGEQAYVICPLVDESETLDVRSAEEEYEALRTGPLKQYRLGLLHGRMTGKQKDEVMSRFASGETQVLVSTSVIEVGIDVANATVMVIEGAERFGLSQMHQFRGRVGRSNQQSYCMLFSTEEDPGPDAHQRLAAMEDTTDGFRLAEVDLGMRGEGEAWGEAQSGMNSMLRVARLTDRDLLLRARELAAEVLEVDPLLQKPEHRGLAAAARPLLARATEAN